MTPEPALIARFATDLDALISPAEPLGLAVSGGPDSLALLLLAAEARPGRVQAATVDHGLRPESADEARFVADVCGRLAVPHETLRPKWVQPSTAIQERARVVRYAALGAWAERSGLAAVATGQHADDQAETLLMRLVRGSGVRGLAGMRGRSTLPGRRGIGLLRPLLSWRRSELESVCIAAGIEPIRDPSNGDERFERARIRARLAEAHWLEPGAIANSASHLAAADEALEWSARQQVIVREGGRVRYQPGDAPPELRRRVLAHIIAELASEGCGEPLRGREINRVMSAIAAGATTSLRGVRCRGGEEWLFDRAPPRRN